MMVGKWHLDGAWILFDTSHRMADNLLAVSAYKSFWQFEQKEVDGLALFSASVDVVMFGDFDGARPSGLAAQGIAQWLDEEVSLRSLSYHRPPSCRGR